MSKHATCVTNILRCLRCVQKALKIIISVGIQANFKKVLYAGILARSSDYYLDGKFATYRALHSSYGHLLTIAVFGSLC